MEYCTRCMQARTRSLNSWLQQYISFVLCYSVVSWSRNCLTISYLSLLTSWDEARWRENRVIAVNCWRRGATYTAHCQQIWILNGRPTVTGHSRDGDVAAGCRLASKQVVVQLDRVMVMPPCSNSSRTVNVLSSNSHPLSSSQPYLVSLSHCITRCMALTGWPTSRNNRW